MSEKDERFEPHYDYVKLTEGVVEAWEKWAKSVTDQFHFIFEQLEEAGVFDEDVCYAEDLNDPYWADEEWDVFV